MRTKYSVLIMFSIFILNTTYSQKSDFGNWLIYFGNQKISKNLNIWNEIQYRSYNAIGDTDQLILRTGLGYNLIENNNNVLAGYAFINSKNYVGLTDEKV